MEENKTNRNFLVLIVLFALCILVNIAVYFYLGGYNGYDIAGHWSICAYPMHGYNPYPLIGVDEGGPVPEIWGIPDNFSAVPWGCLLGNAFYAGFLPMEAAQVYNAVLHFVFLVLTMFVLWENFAKQLTKKKALLLALLLVGAHFSFMYSIHYGNAGGVICCMLMMSIYLSKKHPYLAGVLLAFAMAKPQIAAIVCIIYLLEGRWKALFSAAAIDIAAWVVMAILTDTNMFTLLIQTFTSGTASEVQYLGLFTVLRHFGLSKGLIMIANMAVGVAYTLGLWYYLRRHASPDTPVPLYFAPACIASVFWVYKNGTDYMIVALAVIFFCMLYLRNDLPPKDRILAFFCIGYLQMSRVAVYLAIVIVDENQMLIDLAKSADGLLLAVVGVLLCRMWVQYHPATEPNTVRWLPMGKTVKAE